MGARWPPWAARRHQTRGLAWDSSPKQPLPRVLAPPPPQSVVSHRGLILPAKALPSDSPLALLLRRQSAFARAQQTYDPALDVRMNTQLKSAKEGGIAPIKSGTSGTLDIAKQQEFTTRFFNCRRHLAEGRRSYDRRELSASYCAPSNVRKQTSSIAETTNSYSTRSKTVAGVDDAIGSPKGTAGAASDVATVTTV